MPGITTYVRLCFVASINAPAGASLSFLQHHRSPLQNQSFRFASHAPKEICLKKDQYLLAYQL